MLLKGSQVERGFYSLTEAAERAECEPSHLMNFASLNKLNFVTPVPVGKDVCSVNGAYIDMYPAGADVLHLSASIPPPMPINDPQNLVLVLRKWNFDEIERHGKTELSDFDKGYSFSLDQPQLMIPAGVSPFLNPSWVWRLYCHGNKCKIKLTKKDLYVMHSDLIRLVETEIKPWESIEERSKRIRESIVVELPARLRRAKKLRQTNSKNITSLPEVERQLIKEDLRGDHKNCLLQADRKSSEAHVEEIVPSKPLEGLSKDHLEPFPKAAIILRLKQVMVRTGLARSTIYDKLNPKSPRYDTAFPRQINLGPGSVGWLEAEIQIWLESRINASRKDT